MQNAECGPHHEACSIEQKLAVFFFVTVQHEHKLDGDWT